ncbi:hypothetical protein Cs7R123_66790 [Catellatospora sp. TT07R-123]|uniref:DUF4145 domain-containing protein n=1 Tax=Catellatospora sp. TT07R-123 TaxID=2733863 RepID=UPI001B22AF23|nr:DUF4145 domain-containing protein [Catellatospora sp. TT07R-123]GHJ49337.1 hypothetical protein Cs7R123_66790 [Catellatospora sp. TT07R-123]
MTDFVPAKSAMEKIPSPENDQYLCPHSACGVFALMKDLPLFRRVEEHKFAPIRYFQTQQCMACNENIVWYRTNTDGWRMVFPLSKVGVSPSADMPDDVRAIYEEARDVSTLSPRSAAALLRLSLQMLVDDIEPGSGQINDKIAKLVQKGLDPQVQQAMDVLRVVGNNAVHPGEIQIDNSTDLVGSLFALVNVIVDQMISRPKRIGTLFAALPQRSRDQIAQRDAVP